MIKAESGKKAKSHAESHVFLINPTSTENGRILGDFLATIQAGNHGERTESNGSFEYYGGDPIGIPLIRRNGRNFFSNKPLVDYNRTNGLSFVAIRPKIFTNLS